MRTYSLSASKVESFNRWMRGYSTGTPEALANEMMTKVAPTPQMRRGDLIHSIIEHPEAHRLEFAGRTYYGDPSVVLLDAETVDRLCAYRTATAVREVPLVKTYPFGPADVITVSMRVDQMDGLTISDEKTRWRTASDYDVEQRLEQIADSMQWRLYLDAAPHCDAFIYHQWWLTEPDPVVRIAHEIHPVFGRPSDLDQQITDLLDCLWAFAQHHSDLLQHMERRQTSTIFF